MKKIISAMHSLVLLFSFLVPTAAFAAADLSLKNVDSKNWYWERESRIVVTEYKTESPPQLVFTNTDVTQCRLNQKPCDPKTPISLEVDRRRIQKTVFTLEYRDGGAAKPVRVEIELLSNVPAYLKLWGRSKIEENILFSPWIYAMVVSPRGELIYYRGFPDGVQDFKTHVVDGRLYYSYLAVSSVSTDNTNGIRVILDDHFNEIERLTRETDGHEFLYLGPKHYIYVTYDSAQTPTGSCYLNQTITEEENGQVVQSFSAYDYQKLGYIPEPPYVHTFRGQSCVGNFHINAFQIVDADHWLISFGNGSIILWNKTAKKSDWILGGIEDQFSVPAKFITHLHHTPAWRAGEQSLVLFDNDYLRKTSRLLEYKLDLTEKKLVTATETKLNNGYSVYGGSVERHGPSLFSIGFGMGEKSVWDFAEFSSGKPTMTITFHSKNERLYNYRVYRSPAQLR